MAVGDVIEVTFYCRLGDQLGVNVRHYVVATEAGTGAGLPAIATGFATDLAPSYAALLTNNAQFRGVRAQKIFPLPRGMSAEALNVTQGTGGASALPGQSCGVLTYLTSVTGRSHRGRTYTPFPSENDNDADGNPEVGYVAVQGQLGADLITPRTYTQLSGGSSLIAVVWSRVLQAYDLVVSVRSNIRWGTQRRRGGYGRPNPTGTF